MTRHAAPAPLTPRFSLRTLLLGVTALGVFFGLFWWLSPLAIAAVVLSLLAVAGHVLGNALGTKLRDGAPIRPHSTDQAGIADPAQPIHAPATHLGARWSLGWGTLLPTAIGVLLGIVGGCVWIESVYQIGFDPYGLAIAGIAFGLLGGFVAFALASFTQVLAVAVLQAMQHK